MQCAFELELFLEDYITNRAEFTAAKQFSQNLHKTRDKLVSRDNKMKRFGQDSIQQLEANAIKDITSNNCLLKLDMVIFTDKHDRIISEKE